MSRSDIKIIEFPFDDEQPATPGSPGSGSMKIIEFDEERADSRVGVATGKDVGHIKIIEFDDPPRREAEPARARPGPPARPVKIIEFDAEDGTQATHPETPKIKIVEFD